MPEAFEVGDPVGRGNLPRFGLTLEGFTSVLPAARFLGGSNGRQALAAPSIRTPPGQVLPLGVLLPAASGLHHGGRRAVKKSTMAAAAL